jgi:hypothetical protein
MGLDFSSADFHPVTPEERLSKYRAMAEEAMMLAFLGEDREVREAYSRIAKCWTGLADDLQARG